jgi:hypothetical protein
VAAAQYTCKHKYTEQHNETEYPNGTYITIRIHKQITLHRINISKQLQKMFQNASRQDSEPEAPPSVSATCVFPAIFPDVPANVS